jgi:hypothetical protein
VEKIYERYDCEIDSGDSGGISCLDGGGPGHAKLGKSIGSQSVRGVQGQGAYRKIQVHDKNRGTLQTAEKESLQREIEWEILSSMFFWRWIGCWRQSHWRIWRE